MLKRLSIATGAALLAGLIFAASVIAGTATYQDRVFRYRAVSGENVVLRFGTGYYDETSSRPKYMWAETRAAPSVGSSCSVWPYDWPYNTIFEVFCALTSSETEREIRYRVSLSDGDDLVDVVGDFAAGVVYGGAGGDNLGEYGKYGRIFGGSGNDLLAGPIAYGGPGDDVVARGTTHSQRPVLRGGRGDDSMEGPGRVYGGRGDDRLRANLNGADMLVGGPGRDIVTFPSGGDEHRDVARLRGGGADIVRCDARLYRSDTLLVDASDRVLPRCEGARVLVSGQPRDGR